MIGTRKTLIILGLILILALTPPTNAQTISEICPTSCASLPFEWVEIYNDTDNSIHTNSIRVTDDRDQSLTWQTSELLPHSYALATSSSILNNSGDTVFVKDASGSVIAQQAYSGSIPTNVSFSRCFENTWQSSASTPLSDNAPSCITPSQDETTVKKAEDPDNTYLSEVMVDPGTGSEEWVELYNNNASNVTLANWSVDDGEGIGASPFTFSLTIPALGYATITLNKTMFNNDTDKVRLINSQGVEKDSFTYSKTQKEKSIGKTNLFASAVCIQNPSQNMVNTTCLTESTSTSNSTTTATSLFPTQTPSTHVLSTTNVVATNEERLASKSSRFSLPHFFSQIKGVSVNTRKTQEKKPKKEEYKTASSYAATSFMFSWANICYILIKLRQKYKKNNDSLTL